MTKDTALRMAIEVFDMYGNKMNSAFADEAYQACKDALEQPTAEQSSLVQEPSAWLYYHNRMVEPLVLEFEEPDTTKQFESDVTWKKPLYTTPPSREWVGLSDDEVLRTLVLIQDFSNYKFARAIEAKLREKNG